MTRLETLLAKDNRANWPSLKIAILTPYDTNTPSGVNENADATAINLKKKGHDVTRFAPGKRNTNGIQSRKTSGYTIPIPTGRSVSKVGGPHPYWWKAARSLNGSYDVVHIHDPATLGFHPILTAFILDRSRTGNIATFHASAQEKDWLRDAYSFVLDVSQLKKLAARNIHHRLAVSKPALDFSTRYFPGKYEILSNPLDVGKFTPDGDQEDLQIEGQTTFFYLARHGENEKRKGLRYLARAFKEVCENRKDVHLFIAGRGKIDSESRAFIDQIPKSCISIVGEISADILPNFYRSVDVVIAPSDSNESFGYVPAEAMASGKPLILSNIDGYANAVIGDVSRSYAEAQELFTDIHDYFIVHNGAVLFEAGHVKQLEHAINLLAGNSNMRMQLGERGREVMVDNFSVDALTDRLEDIYFDVLRGMPDESNLANRLNLLYSSE